MNQHKYNWHENTRSKTRREEVEKLAEAENNMSNAHNDKILKEHNDDRRRYQMQRIMWKMQMN